VRKVVAVGGAIAAVLLGGGAVLAARGGPGGGGGGDGVAGARGAVASTLVVTTTTSTTTAGAAAPATTEPGHEHGPGEDGMPHEEPSPVPPSSGLTCAPGYGAGPAAPGPAAPAPAGQAVALGPPGVECHETVTGCVVAFSLRWSDGHVERASRAIDAAGGHRLEGDRGTVADFVVDGARTCPTPSVTYRAAWTLP
jgi:hypothetical protein